MLFSSSIFSKCAAIVLSLKGHIQDAGELNNETLVLLDGWISRMEWATERSPSNLLAPGGIEFTEYLHSLERDFGILASHFDRMGRPLLALRCWDAQAGTLTDYLQGALSLEFPVPTPGNAYLDYSLAQQKLADTLEARGNLLAELWRLDEAADTFEQAFDQLQSLEGPQNRYVRSRLARWLLSAAKHRIEIGQPKSALCSLEERSNKLLPTVDNEDFEFPTEYIRCARFQAELAIEIEGPGEAIEIIEGARKLVEPFFRKFDGEVFELSGVLSMLTDDLPAFRTQMGQYEQSTCFAQARSLIDSLVGDEQNVSSEELEKLRQTIDKRASARVTPANVDEVVRELVENSTVGASAMLANIDADRRTWIGSLSPFFAIPRNAWRLCELGHVSQALSMLKKCSRHFVIRPSDRGERLERIVFVRSQVADEFSNIAAKHRMQELGKAELEQYDRELSQCLGSASDVVLLKYAELMTHLAARTVPLSGIDDAVECLEKGFIAIRRLCAGGESALTSDCNHDELVLPEHRDVDQKAAKRHLEVVTQLGRRKYGLLWAQGRLDEANQCRADTISALKKLAQRTMHPDDCMVQRFEALHAFS